MSIITLNHTVAQLVRERSARSCVIESLGIDYCWGGKKTLSEVCRKKDLDPQALLERFLPEDAALPVEAGEALDSMSLSAIIENILVAQHDYLKVELPRLAAMLHKAARVYGNSEPRLLSMEKIFLRFSQKLSCHMTKEENILFPAIVQMEQNRSLDGCWFGSVHHPIAHIEAEHEGAGCALEDLNTLSDGYTPPDWACNTYRALLHGLHELEQNMHTHVHNENNVLFPRAIALEDLLKGGAFG